MIGLLEVKEKKWLTPHYVRVVLTGDDVLDFQEANVGDNNKILLPPDGKNYRELPEISKATSKKFVRTYTLRALAIDKREMVIDFVVHGEEGPASNWVINSEIGDQLVVAMKARNKPLFYEANYYLLYGDHTALPVISVMLEMLPDDAIGRVVLEVFDEEDVQDLKKPSGMAIQWVFNDQPGEKVLLPEVFKKEVVPDDSRFIFIAAEYQSVKEVRALLQENEQLSREEWRAYSYWKYGQSEDASLADRGAVAHRG